MPWLALAQGVAPLANATATAAGGSKPVGSCGAVEVSDSSVLQKDEVGGCEQNAAAVGFACSWPSWLLNSSQSGTV